MRDAAAEDGRRVPRLCITAAFGISCPQIIETASDSVINNKWGQVFIACPHLLFPSEFLPVTYSTLRSLESVLPDESNVVPGFGSRIGSLFFSRILPVTASIL